MSGTGRFSIQYADETVAFAIQILRQPGIWMVLCRRNLQICRNADKALESGHSGTCTDDVSLAVKKRETKSQKKLNAVERMRNLKDAFQITESVRGLRILIVDDVYTTGSTIETLAECLKESGAGEIYFVTLCIGQL